MPDLTKLQGVCKYFKVDDLWGKKKPSDPGGFSNACYVLLLAGQRCFFLPLPPGLDGFHEYRYERDQNDGDNDELEILLDEGDIAEEIP